jgi:nitroreductase/NAD-dependent dihydropyrimidine dehydrogenase PreA subunit
MLDFRVQSDRCNHCGLCVLDCPARIIEMGDDKLPSVSSESQENCLECQHCLAICPTGAVSVFGLNPNDSLPGRDIMGTGSEPTGMDPAETAYGEVPVPIFSRPLPQSAEVWPRLEQMTHLLRGRRSVRHYRDENVDSRLIDRLLATVANAPTGVNNRSLTFTVIADKDQLHRLREKTMQALVKAAGEGRIPERFAYIHTAISAYVEHQADVIFRGAPHVLIVSAPPDSPCATEDVAIALAYFELLAQSAGLGTVWCGLLKLALESAPELKPLLDLRPGHHYYAMLFGPPAIHYARTVQRDNAATVNRPKIS